MIRPLGAGAVGASIVMLAALAGCGKAAPRSRVAGDADAGVQLAIDGGPAVAGRVVARSLTGSVERRAGDRWVAIAVGDELSANDEIRTAAASVLELDLGGETRVTIGEATKLTIGEVSASVSRVLLGDGQVSARAAAGSPRIRLETRAGDAVVEAGDGEFAAIASGAGDLTVATAKGTATFTARGASVDVPAGQQSTARPGAAPTQPTPIPASLFLKVKPLGGDSGTTAVHGETVPGAVVSINGVRQPTDAAGRFDSKVAALEGDNIIVVQVEDASGRRERKVLRRNVDTRPPDVKAEVTW